MNQSASKLDQFLPVVSATACLALLVIFQGCGGSPNTIERPSIDAYAAAVKAIEMFDQDGDGLLSMNEIEVAPNLKAAAERMKLNGPLTPEILSTRFQSYFGSAFVMTGVSCRVTLNGRPLSGAEVTFQPPEFFGGQVESATAVTDPNGLARPTQPGQPGLYLGSYTVHISKKENGAEAIPERYNSQSEIGVEVCRDGREITTEFDFALKSP